eukprot:2140526-Pyramimonas_sp.AAC.1
MSAQDFAVLCYHFNVCEVPGGDWSKYALKPGGASGNYKQFLDRRLPTSGPFYCANIPATVRKRSTQKTMNIPIRKIYRTIAVEAQQNAGVQGALKDGEHDVADSVMSLP